MEATAAPVSRDRLLNQRQRLESAATSHSATAEVTRLLQEVDAALERIDAGTFGLCATCHDAIEPDRLLADPLIQFCLDHLTPAEQRALEQDLELASRIQRELLPKPGIRLDGWDIAHYYQSAGPVSGDYCDILAVNPDHVYFLLGDVAGKGVAAALLMSHLSATLRTLVTVGLPLSELMERVSRIFCESTLAMHYATLVCGRASSSGEVEICNAGHPPPLLIRGGEIERLDATGLPIGMFSSVRFSSRSVRLAPGDMLLLYTDGLSEAQNPAGDDYGIERLSALAASANRRPQATIDACLRDAVAFRGAPGFADDVTMLAVSRL